MYGRQFPSGGGGFGLTGPVPRDIWLLLGVVFATFSLRFFESTALLPEFLRLSSAVWQRAQSAFPWTYTEPRWASWQSVHTTPARCILLWTHEPYT